jgi:hypothetical protein
VSFAIVDGALRDTGQPGQLAALTGAGQAARAGPTWPP